MGLDNGEEYVTECQGEAAMDLDKLNNLIADCDPHALAFFGLTNTDEDKPDEWDTNDLDELPSIKDFVAGFEQVETILPRSRTRASIGQLCLLWPKCYTVNLTRKGINVL